MKNYKAMRKLKFIGLPFLLLSCQLFAQKTNILVDANWLKNRMKQNDLVILHIGMEENYKKEHIPGAVFIAGDEYTVDNDPHVFDLPPDATLKNTLESKGVSSSTDVVIYTGENWIPMVTRLYFTFDYLGHASKTYVLNGGLTAWKDGGGALSSETPSRAKGIFSIKPNPGLVADQVYVLKSIKDANTNIVDCRAAVFYNGIEPTHGARKGRIPGAKTIPYTSLYEKTSTGAYEFKSLEDLGAIFTAQGLSKDKQLVLYCHIGMQLTVVYTSAKLLGYTDIKIYDGSFHEWGPNEKLPIEID
ncbi:MAG: rhodanese-like domain-containing protein [Imperialibacter sp.]|uniref:sulfurtransferase n=2 Tax=Imperialibacter sp. TaxID=2038411 RepID=UPI0032EBCA33